VTTAKLSRPHAPPATPSPWWSPDRHEDRRPFLLARGRIKSAIRNWFENQGFIEVETAALQISPGNETHLHAFKTVHTRPDGTTMPLYLHTSPEFACKKLLAAGEQKIFTFAPTYRNREQGPLHAAEFTMLEWYEVGAEYTALMHHCREILRITASTAQTHMTQTQTWCYRDKTADPFAEPTRIDVAQKIAAVTGINIADTLHQTHPPPSDLGPSDLAPSDLGIYQPDRDALAAAATAAEIRVVEDDTWSDIFTRILLDHVEPNLGEGRPAFLDRYPIPEATLARPAPDDPRFAERFELYCCGIELANGFGELTDPETQRNRLEAEMDEKFRIYGERYPIDEDFLSALRHMPPSAGCALGFDRLVMLATGAQRLDQVIWTPAALNSEPGPNP